MLTTIDVGQSSVYAQNSTSTLNSVPITPAPNTSDNDDDSPSSDDNNSNNDDSNSESSGSSGSDDMDGDFIVDDSARNIIN